MEKLKRVEKGEREVEEGEEEVEIRKARGKSGKSVAAEGTTPKKLKRKKKKKERGTDKSIKAPKEVRAALGKSDLVCLVHFILLLLLEYAHHVPSCNSSALNGYIHLLL